ncbi:MAG TPA: helix-turn-helix domain-containing protein [Abditibacteriaceae bacterium]
MEVKLSGEEVKAIAAEVVKQLGAAGLTMKDSAAPAAKAAPAGKPAAKSAGKTQAKAAAKTAPAETTESAPEAPAAAKTSGAVYGIDSAAEVIGLHPNTVRRHVKSGTIKASLVKGSWQIKQRDLDQFARSLSKGK